MNKNSTLRGLMYTNFFSLSIKSFLWILSTSANFFQKNLTKNFTGKTSIFSYKINIFEETKFPFKSFGQAFEKACRSLRASPQGFLTS